MSTVSQSIEKVSQKELLEWRLCDLPVTLNVPWFLKLSAQVNRGLAARGLLFRPHYWISDEWFCPDSVPGVAVPFFLLHPKLEKLERQQMGWVDGSSETQKLKILRHEVGHAFDNAYRLREKFRKQRENLFGSSEKKYPEFYTPQLFSRAYVRNLGLGYAQSHPDEDFAETFAVWLTNKKIWKQKYRNTAAFQKLLLIDKMAQSVRAVSPNLKNTRRLDPIENNKITLGDYYSKKRRYYGIDAKTDAVLLSLQKLRKKLNVTQRTKAKTSSEFNVADIIADREQKLLNASCESLQVPKYVVQPFLKIYRLEIQKQNLHLHKKPTVSTLETIEKNFLMSAEKYLARGDHRIFL